VEQFATFRHIFDTLRLQTLLRFRVAIYFAIFGDMAVYMGHDVITAIYFAIFGDMAVYMGHDVITNV